MIRRTTIRLSAILFTLLLATAPLLAQLYHEPQAAPKMGLDPILTNVGIDQHLEQKVPLDLKFRDENGNDVVLGQYFGKKPVMLAMVYYTCPMICSEVLKGLASGLMPVKFEVGKDFDVVVVSIDPKDTPREAMGKKRLTVNRYGKTQSAGGWHFLSGNEAEIKSLANAVGFRYAYDPKSGQYAHPTVVEMLTPEGKISRYFYGIDYSSRDIQFGLIDASHNKIGSVVDQAVLYCYHYDPSTSRYSVQIMRLVQIAGALTAVLLGGFVFVMVRKEKTGLQV